MKTYLVKSDTNHELMVHVVNADNEEEAIRIAKAHKKKGARGQMNECGAWDNCESVEVDTATRGVVCYA